MCVASKGRSDHYHKEAPESKDGDVARVQMDFMFVRAEGSFADEPRAKATVLMVICKDDGNLAATVVRTKTTSLPQSSVGGSPRDRSSGTCEWNGSGSTSCLLF